jgi:phosphoadenosine phosphosulfate reductase
MRRILKRHEIVPAGCSVIEDEWRHFGEDAADTDALLVPLAELRKNADTWLARPGRLGVRLAPAESVESLSDVLPRLALVAVEFPGVGDGRGFSYGRLLRDRLSFKGELRAVGAGVKQDKIFLLARCGFESFELPPEEKADEALAALHRYDVVYQPAEAIDGIKRQRFFA